ncbi:Creatininase [Tepidanaerobacter acetatoxydans Re1]|uniref:Creatininase n=1 Tax=Tepidanaerobacter acetatoxydans (strain DSM 21804 / JCM 16047 / Re1) TaxID=1209989 RepID=F4LQY9_TEPAE|nr:creatininase family protein [Tepidanaerobacter acetatoxydans]AEE92142.1 Creatininase [Tepidanaerobacter acetatoxydans Re1]CCP26997.1 Creatininase [Tepidanaerobacter acetatoxydans Re1]
MDMQKLTYLEFQEFISKKPIAILPIGAVEAHGPHLPIGTDNYLAERLSRKVAEKVDALVLPTFSYGQVWSLRNVPGSINVSNEHLTGVLTDIGKSLYKFGVRYFVIINTHVGNMTAIKEAARNLYDFYKDLKVFYFIYPGTAKITKEVRESKPMPGGYFHACEIETSYMLYLAPDYVKMDKALDDFPDLPEDFEYTPTPWDEITDTIVLGSATLATEEKGQKIIDVAVETIVKILEKTK